MGRQVAVKPDGAAVTENGRGTAGQQRSRLGGEERRQPADQVDAAVQAAKATVRHPMLERPGAEAQPEELRCCDDAMLAADDPLQLGVTNVASGSGRTGGVTRRLHDGHNPASATRAPSSA
jgi:hypothetical protein